MLSLRGGPWHVASQPMILRNWEPGVTLSKEAQSTVPIWCNILCVPLEYQCPEGISRIASAIGRPLHVDRVTAGGTRITFARVCIEIDAENVPPNEIQVNVTDPRTGNKKTIFLNVEYQWMPSRCPKCKVFGHNCDSIPKPSKVQPNKATAASSDGWKVKRHGKEVVEEVANSTAHVNIANESHEMKSYLNNAMTNEDVPSTSTPVCTPGHAGCAVTNADVTVTDAIIAVTNLVTESTPVDSTATIAKNVDTTHDVASKAADVNNNVTNVTNFDVSTDSNGNDAFDAKGDTATIMNEELNTPIAELFCRLDKGNQTVMAGKGPAQTPTSNQFAALSKDDDTIKDDCDETPKCQKVSESTHKGSSNAKKGKKFSSSGKGARRR